MVPGVLVVRSTSVSPVFLPVAAAVSILAAGLWFADRHRPRETPFASKSPRADVADAAAPVPPRPIVRDDAELARLRAEVRKLREELASAKGSIEDTRQTLAQATRELERLRRPLEIDMASTTLRANLAPGEGVVTGGYRLPDGTRLFAFVETDSLGDGGVGVASRFFAVPEELVQTLGLQTLSTEAANTLQHGEVWVRDELEQIAGALEQTSGVRLLTAGHTDLQPGRPGEVTLPTGPGDPPLSLNVNAVFDSQRNLDLELRVESVPAENQPNAATPPP